MKTDSIDSLLMSPQLDELVELLKTGDGLLDIISLRETQHSSIMAWMFDSREGHGQGDSILRDLLASTSLIATSAESTIDKRSKTAEFFKCWTPSRIRSGGFNSSFILTEYNCGDGIGRLDLLVIDPVNKFFIVIENKAGAPLTDLQLRKYREFCVRWIDGNSRFRGYKCAFLALDKSVSEEDGEEAGPSARSNAIPEESKHWLIIGYSWLALAAQRATMNIYRGNSAARLIQGYCRQQTDWRSDSDRRADELAAILWENFPESVKRLVENASNPGRSWINDESWDGSDQSNTFAVQNRDVVRVLKQNEGIRMLRKQILDAGVQESEIRVSPRRLDLMLWRGYAINGAADGSWKVYLRAFRRDSGRYLILLRVDRCHLDNEDIAGKWRSFISDTTKKSVNSPGQKSYGRMIIDEIQASQVCRELINWRKIIEERRYPIE